MERKKAGMKCVIFAGLPAAPELHSWWADADYVIAADAGYENACRVGVEPDLLLGDYDSAPRPEAGAKTVFLPAEKDDTDTYYAARKARSWARRMSLSWAVWEARGWTIRWPTCKRWCFWQKTECVRRWRIRTMR